MESDTGKDLGREEQYCGITLSPSGADYRSGPQKDCGDGEMGCGVEIRGFIIFPPPRWMCTCRYRRVLCYPRDLGADNKPISSAFATIGLIVMTASSRRIISVFDYAESPRQRRRRSVCLRKMRHVQVGADRGEQGLSLGPDTRARKKSVSAK